MRQQAAGSRKAKATEAEKLIKATGNRGREVIKGAEAETLRQQAAEV